MPTIAKKKKSVLLTPLNKAQVKEDSFKMTRALSIFRISFRSLCMFLEHAEGSEKLRTAAFDRKDISGIKDEYLEELDHLLFNALTAMGALIDISRRLLNKYSDQSFVTRFSEENKELVTDPHILLIRQLKNFITHGYLDQMNLYSSYNGITKEERLRYLFKVEPFKQYLHDREIFTLDHFLESSDENIYLLPIMEEYRSLMINHWQTFLVKFLALYVSLGGTPYEIMKDFKLGQKI